MPRKGILLDSSIIIDYFRKTNKEKALLHKLQHNWPAGYELIAISSLTVFELYCGATDGGKKEDLDAILVPMKVVLCTAKVAKQAGNDYIDLKKRNQLIGTLDILIGATSIVYGYPLLTLNREHFQRIHGIKLFEL